MPRTMLAAALSIAWFATAARAEEPQTLAALPSTPIRASIQQVRFGAPYRPLPVPQPGQMRHNGTAQKITAGFALGFLGLMAGAVIGGSAHYGCTCDDPSLTGGVIGGSIGAAAGAIMGVRLASQ